ncbi:MAG TPA: aminotransferase class III-fold pyridoxal phosphate-dependent enzyme, partial [Acetobacteraceae bacterium]|nr:aminotransferase class III-fold pyridoxal phosphate-dependent enzyme [Acetobacteraceae bacterium]
TLSKALSGGFLPIAATIASRELFDAFLSDNPADALMHGPTYMANALACAAANASLDLFETNDRLGAVSTIAAQLRAGLEPCRALPHVVDVRVRGGIGVVQLDRIADPQALRQKLIGQGVWVRPFRDIVYLTPAFTIEPADLTRLTDAVAAALQD